ncbi:DUF692 family protein [bacterium]|nr:DUF692 family protein [bacterium]
MSDFGAAPAMDWVLRGAPMESASFKWGLPFLPHLYETFSKAPSLPAFEVSLDRLMAQQPGSLDGAWARSIAQKTDVCLLSRLANLGSEHGMSDAQLSSLAKCVADVSPRWLAFAVGFNAQGQHSLQNPMPVPQTREMIDNISKQVTRIRSAVGRDVALVNVSSMFKYSFETLSQAQFWRELVDAVQCKVVFDIPAFYVSLYHRDQDFQQELAKFPLESVVSLRVGALALSTHGVVDAECGRLSVTHWGLLEDVLHALPGGEHRAVFLKWFEPLVSGNDLIAEIISGQSALNRLGEI